jgi:dihydrofolate reductase
MRKLIACVFFYSLDGLLADEGTEYWRFCFGLPDDPADKEQSLDRYRSAYAHIMGRVAYEFMAAACLFRRIRSVVPTNSITPGRRLREQPTRGVAYPSMITSFSVVGE